jgi:UDP-N-acetylmuramyl pentapeptide synthase
MIGALKAFFVTHATIVSYMLQSTEYQIGPYLKWYWRTQNFANVMHRRVLNPTSRARLLRAGMQGGMVLQIAFGAALIVTGLRHSGYDELLYFGIALVISYPVIWAHLVVVPLLLARWLVVEPKQRELIAKSELKFTEHSAIKIAVVGSYGKTTMKEMLATVLSQGKKVAATPANKNVSSSHAHFVDKLDNDEDILIIEYGEGAPGDVSRFAQITHPTHAVITGLAPAHLDKYNTLAAAAKDIFSVADFVSHKNVFVNEESESVRSYIQPDFRSYDQTGTNGWKVSKSEINLGGTKFTLTKGRTKLSLKSGMLGRHQIGPLSAAAALAFDLGLSPKQVIDGIAMTRPFEHRMQPYQLSGATIIDDTYNGNLEGIKAGTALLKELKTNGKKWYVSPGLVDQGKDTANIHIEIGRLIADSDADIVVLMQNSVTNYIQQGLQQGNWKGELRIESDPLEFYTNLEHFVSYGDVVLMQNDWTDNYA